MSNTTFNSLKFIDRNKIQAIKDYKVMKDNARQKHKDLIKVSRFLNNHPNFEKYFYFNRNDASCSYWITNEFGKDLFEPTIKPKRKSNKNNKKK